VLETEAFEFFRIDAENVWLSRRGTHDKKWLNVSI
jgi:hypothetical protein